jgi:hypothetical protein
MKIGQTQPMIEKAQRTYGPFFRPNEGRLEDQSTAVPIKF